MFKNDQGSTEGVSVISSFFLLRTITYLLFERAVEEHSDPHSVMFLVFQNFSVALHHFIEFNVYAC